MSRLFGMVTTSIWASRRFHNLKSDKHRLAYLYLLANTHGNSIGAYRLPLAYMADDLSTPDSTVTVDMAKAALKDMCDAGLAEYDAAEHVVRIVGWFDHNPISNRKHLQGSIKAFQALPKATRFSVQIVMEMSFSMVLRVRGWSSDEKGARATMEAMETVAEICREVISRVGQEAFEEAYHVLPEELQIGVHQALSIPLLIPVPIPLPIQLRQRQDTETDTEIETHTEIETVVLPKKKPSARKFAQKMIDELNHKAADEQHGVSVGRLAP